MRDLKGRYIKGRIEPLLHKESRLKALRASVVKNPNYLGDIKNHPLYNIWRAFKFTKKGKDIGNNPNWDSYKVFYNDVILSYVKGKRFNRIDTSKPYSKDNFIFLTPKEVATRNKVHKPLTYKGETRDVEEWALIHDLRLKPLLMRYYQGRKNNHSPERILFGYIYVKKREVVDYKKLSYQKTRNKASKMISSYNNRDVKKGFGKSNLTIDWFISNVFGKNCTYCGTTDKIGADRVNNKLGHNISNIVPCCNSCNLTRGDRFSSEEMLILGVAIKKIKQKRN